MILPRFKIQIKSDSLKLDEPSRERLRKYLAGLPDGPGWLVIDRMRKQRSDNQNRYYWGVAIEILSEHFGYTKDEMHSALRLMFLRVPGADGKPDTIKSTTDLDTIGFEEYLSQIRDWAIIEHNCYIPLPNEVALPECEYA